jgi:nicotinic acid mononucleotide adenylyltransferase
MRIGLLGGSFDPAHSGHLYVSEIARKALDLDYVWWLVSPGNVLKPAPDALCVRLRRARHVARDRHIFVTGIEAQLGTRYTIDTVTALQKRLGVARHLRAAPSLVVLDGPRSSESSTELRERALGATAEAMLNPVT